MNLTKKDQAAIDHVASVSNNPHAAMIIKQLITGWGVEFEYAVGEWKISDFPTWSPGSKYRLIEPKPAKPAYRVYVDANGKPANVIRFPNGTFSHANIEDTKWLSDWIEYDPPKKWPTPLVERIAEIDIKAAEWIVDNWDELLDKKYTRNGNRSRISDKLSHMFAWDESPQGRKYWLDIALKLGE